MPKPHYSNSEGINSPCCYFDLLFLPCWLMSEKIKHCLPQHWGHRGHHKKLCKIHRSGGEGNDFKSAGIFMI